MIVYGSAIYTILKYDKFINEISERYPNIKNASHREKHKLAKNYLSFGDVESAWKLLLS